MERIAIHTATLGGMATDIAFLQGGSTYGRLRTAIINASQRVCGNRFGRGWLRPGTARPIDDALRKDLVHTLQAFAIDFAEINTLMLASSSVKARLQGTGTLNSLAARELGLSGVAARASGVAHDARTLWPAGAYQAFPLPMVTEPQGDCAARMCVRMRETQASVSWLLARLQDTALNLCTPTPPNNPAQAALLQANTLCVSVVEGVRGAVVHMLETDSQGTLVHYKVQDPSLTNWFGVAQAVRNNGISDFPICNKSFDLSYCGNDL
jgi:Ni,Fe-hydrogenase III large subunit